jgi:hypothetical protein
MFLKALLDAEMEVQSFDLDQRYARVFALSGKFDDLKGQTSEQSLAIAMSKVLMGRSWGLTRADSIKYVFWVNGKPSFENDIVAKKLRAAGIAWDPEFEFEENPPKGKPPKCISCVLWIKEWDELTKRYKPKLDRKGKEVSVSFTAAEAANIEVYDRNKPNNKGKLIEKDTYQNWAQEMFYWRSIGRLRKFHYPEVLEGGRMREEAGDVAFDEQLPEIAPAPPGVMAASQLAPGEVEMTPEEIEEVLRSENPALKRVVEQTSFLDADKK